MTARVLIVDDDEAMCAMLRAHLAKRGLDVELRTTALDAFDALRARDFDVVVTDLNMRGASGLDLCARIVADRPDVPVVVITAFGSLETAIAAIRAGAYDFVPKPFEVEVLLVALDRAIQHRSLRAEVQRLRREVAGASGFADLIGESVPMRALHDLLARVAASDASVLVTGESGTGKELVARALHRRSARAAGPFVAVNCAAMPEPLLESELFGHLRGAFTDARTSRTGLFAHANGGTLLLDEIAEMPLGLQPKLLRALEDRRARPLGSDTEVPFDVRIIAATNRDIDLAVEQRCFREDLFYRLNVLRVELPPLRARGNDVLLLAQHFLERHARRASKRVAGLSPKVAAQLLRYPWPGNVRELSNSVERAVALARYDEIVVEDLPANVREHRSDRPPPVADDPSQLLPMDEVERRYVRRVLEAVRGNKTEAARVLGFDRTTLYRKLERFGLGRDAESS